MSSLGASKLSLSSITTETLWKRSGRYSENSELLRLKDRKKSGFLLSPTHEEEITALVAGIANSYKDLPIRLYQIGRKYRDERRPRKGLLRAKEFLMKDLYTFDYAYEQGLGTYESVRKAYKNLFDELRIPYLVAEADSGSIGGDLSHEYHFASPSGEDIVWSCNSCGYTANEELVEKRVNPERRVNTGVLAFTTISADHNTAIRIIIPAPDSLSKDHVSTPRIHDYVNLHALNRAGIDIDSSLEPQALSVLLAKTKRSVTIHDRSLPQESNILPLDLTVTRPGDSCSRCASGELDSQPAIEVGHTFHLGTRYSAPLNALVTTPENTEVLMQMGCHGIGVSRLIGAIASLLHDERGLNWPRIIAPFEAVIIMTPQVSEEDGIALYDMLRSGGVDVVLDDRASKSVGWKLKDADLIGYSVVLVLGKSWKTSGSVEVQCRRLGYRENVKEGLEKTVCELLDRL
jgi:prolyl-tRNA synthetase